MLDQPGPAMAAGAQASTEAGTSRRTTRRAVSVLAAMSIAAALAVAAVEVPAVRRQLALSFTRMPTPYTELYFGDSSMLPHALSVPHAYPFTFTVANHEGRTVRYAYVVTASSRLGVAALARGEAVVPSGKTFSKRISFIPTQPRVAYRVSVNLSGNPPELIAFRATS